MNNSSNRILLLCQTHQHAAALGDCIPHLRAHYGWVWVVYSPAVLADPATVEREFDGQIADLTRAMKDCYLREDGAGGDQYKAKRDAAILEKSAKVKDAWKALPKEQQDAAVMRLFEPFFKAIQGVDGMSCAISQAPDHFETVAHVEMQNSLKAGMKPGYVAGDYVVAWPTSLPKGGYQGLEKAVEAGRDLMKEHAKAAAESVREKIPEVVEKRAEDRVEALKPGTFPAAPTVKIDKRTKEYKLRLRELQSMNPDELGPIAFELGISPTDPLAGKRNDLIEKIIELEQTAADVSKY